MVWESESSGSVQSVLDEVYNLRRITAVFMLILLITAFSADARWEPTLEVGVTRIGEDSFLSASTELIYGGLVIEAEALASETDSEFWADATIGVGSKVWLVKPSILLSNYANQAGVNNAGLGGGAELDWRLPLSSNIELRGEAAAWGVYSFNVDQPLGLTYRLKAGVIYGNPDVLELKITALYREGTWYIGDKDHGVGLGFSLGLQKQF